jgi:hypothetical protein
MWLATGRFRCVLIIISGFCSLDPPPPPLYLTVPISKNGLKPRQTDTVGQLQVMAAALLTITTKMRRNCDGRINVKVYAIFTMNLA